MALLTKDRSALLDKFVSDCITFRLSEAESLEYIGKQFGPIHRRTLFRRKKKLLSDESTMAWLNWFCRIGFVELHRKICDNLLLTADDSIRRLYEEKQKEPGKRDDLLILKLKKDIRESAFMISEMSLGTPIVAALKAKLDKAGHGIDFHFRQLTYNK